MEYTIGEYIRKIHLRCTPFRKSCKCTAKLDLEVNLLYLKSVHNHPSENYKSGIYALKTKCERSAQCSSDGLRHVFNEVTRLDPSATEGSNLVTSAILPTSRKLAENSNVGNQIGVIFSLTKYTTSHQT